MEMFQKIIFVLIISIIQTTYNFLDAQNERPDYSGNWELDSLNSKIKENSFPSKSLTIYQDGDVIGIDCIDIKLTEKYVLKNVTYTDENNKKCLIKAKWADNFKYFEVTKTCNEDNGSTFSEIVLYKIDENNRLKIETIKENKTSEIRIYNKIFDIQLY